MNPDRDRRALSAADEPARARPSSRSSRIVRRRPPWKAGIAVAVPLVIAVGAYVWFRPAHLSVITAPSAEVAIDGEPMGSSPVHEHSLSGGAHRITARSDGFLDLDRTLSLDRGSSHVLDVALRPRDPADAVALRRLSEALGVERDEIPLEAPRTRAVEPAAVVLWPRGGRREAPRELVLWARAPVGDVQVVLEEVDAPNRLLHEARIATSSQRTVAPLPDEVRTRIEPGRTYRVRIRDEARDASVPRFWVFAPAVAARLDEEMAERLARVDLADPAREVLRAGLLISRGLIEEALELVTALRDRFGERREVARLALSALARAGLRDIGPWAEWAELLARAKD